MDDASEGGSGETGGAADAAADAAIEGKYTVMYNKLLRGEPTTKVVTEVEKNKMKKDVVGIDLKNIKNFSTFVNDHQVETDVMYHEEMGGGVSDHNALLGGVTGGGENHVEEEEVKGETGSSDRNVKELMKFKRISMGIASNPYAQFTSEEGNE